jgi:hypothetical protein
MTMLITMSSSKPSISISFSVTHLNITSVLTFFMFTFVLKIEANLPDFSIWAIIFLSLLPHLGSWSAVVPRKKFPAMFPSVGQWTIMICVSEEKTSLHKPDSEHQQLPIHLYPSSHVGNNVG